jgi:hypothetical protein
MRDVDPMCCRPCPRWWGSSTPSGLATCPPPTISPGEGVSAGIARFPCAALPGWLPRPPTHNCFVLLVGVTIITKQSKSEGPGLRARTEPSHPANHPSCHDAADAFTQEQATPVYLAASIDNMTMLNGLGLGGFGDPSDPFSGTFGLGGSSFGGFGGRRLLQDPFASAATVDPFAPAASAADPFASAPRADPFSGGSSSPSSSPPDPFGSSGFGSSECAGGLVQSWQ